jgi:molecular chaperone HtpG
MSDTTPNKQNVPEPLIGSFVLESLTTGMYGERRNAIREYVQNSYDSIIAATRLGLIERGAGKVTVTLDEEAASLSIHDNGAGLPEGIAVDTLTAIGASRKQRGEEAGFRGIGRLAGIAFSSKLEFRTKARGDLNETVVTFDCDALREGMLGKRRRHASKLISEATTWLTIPTNDVESHYFKVLLLGLRSAPVEAQDTLQLKNFLAQVAPVDFDASFPFKDQILRELGEKLAEVDATELLSRAGFDFINVVVKQGETGVEQPVYKPYGATYAVGTAKSVALSHISVHVSQGTKTWWGWVGHKSQPGAYKDPAVAGIRFRLKNIQIDGNELIKDIPVINDRRTEWDQRSDLFLGEIYVDPLAVVPNARRDGFEDDDNWLAIRKEIAAICEELTKEAHQVSRKHQLSLDVISRKWGKYQNDQLNIVRADSFDMPKARKLITDMDQLQKDIEKALAGSEAAVVVRLKSISKELSQAKAALLAKPKTPEYHQFREAIKEEVLAKVMTVLRSRLPLAYLDDVTAAINDAVR